MKSALISLIVNRKSLIIVSVLVFSILYSLFSSVAPIFAATTGDPCNPQQSGANFNYSDVVDDVQKCSMSKGTFASDIFTWTQITDTADSVGALITGFSLNHPETNGVTANTGALASMGKTIAALYGVQPTSGVTYFAEKINNMNPVKNAYAQQGGIGYSTLKPVEKLWGVFRDASYLGFIIIFVVIGFMIMFRQKISSQAVATIQDSLPRIVIALVLVTFSYAIAGLFVDLMYVAINLFAAIGQRAGLLPNAANTYFENNIFQLTLSGWDNLAVQTSLVVQSTIQNIINNALHVGGCNFNFGIGIIKDTGDCIGKGIAWILGWVGGIIFGIALIISMVRIFLMLLTSYITIILLTVFAPIILLFQALPGNNGAKDWFKQLFANIAVFPTVVLMFFLAAILGGIGALGGQGSGAFAGKELFNAPLLTSGFDAKTLGNLVAVGLIIMTPSAAKIVKDKFGIKEGALGAGIGAGMAALGAGAGVSKKIAGEAAPMVPPIRRATDYIAARRELPKIKRQVAVAEHADTKGYVSPTAYQRKKPQ